MGSLEDETTADLIIANRRQQKRIAELLQFNNEFEQRMREALRERDMARRQLDWMLEAVGHFDWGAPSFISPSPPNIFQTLNPIPEAKRNADDMGAPPPPPPTTVEKGGTYRR